MIKLGIEANAYKFASLVMLAGENAETVDMDDVAHTIAAQSNREQPA
jgi:hypothetical protein